LTRRVAAALAVAAATAAHADPFFHDLAHEAGQRLDDAIAARAPKLVPPTPVAVHWHAQKLGTLDLGATLVALAATDLDGDGKAELYAVTPRHVVAIALRNHGLAEIGRTGYTGELATPASRDVVGTAVRDGDAIAATVSGWAKSLRVRWHGSQLVGELAEPGFLLCPGERAQLAVGRNYFGSGAGAIYTARCRDDIIDAQGHPLHARAALGLAGKLDVAVERCDANAPCVPTGAKHELTGVGVAFEVADLDRDGTPEVILAGAGAPGDADAVKVVALGGDPKKPLYRRSWSGGVAAIAVADIDGDGALDVICAVRLVGATRVDLWRLN
jgi:hypothetical protein